jgi:hypothetical protein
MSHRRWRNCPAFEVNLAGSEGLAEAATKLDHAVRTAGHEACLGVDEEGCEFVAVFVCGPTPAQELQGRLQATDPLADRIVAYHLVKINDQPHLRCFLRTLQYWGFEPKVVVTDGSPLYSISGK